MASGRAKKAKYTCGMCQEGCSLPPEAEPLGCAGLLLCSRCGDFCEVAELDPQDLAKLLKSSPKVFAAVAKNRKEYIDNKADTNRVAFPQEELFEEQAEGALLEPLKVERVWVVRPIVKSGPEIG